MVSRIPKNRPPSHPGAILKEIYLDDMKITQTELASRVGCTVTKVSEIINGKRSITPEFALDLAEALGTTAEMWVNLQGTYDLWKAIEKRNRSA